MDDYGRRSNVYGYVGNNPYNTSVFNEVRPTYVGPPVEDIGAARENLTQTARDNRLAQGLLEQTFADSVIKMGEDPDGVNLIMQHKTDFENGLADIISSKNYAYAGPAIQSYATKFAGDYRIKGRQKLIDDLEGQREAIRSNKNLSPTHQKAYLDGLTLDRFAERDDERGIYNLKEVPMPYEKVDVSKALLDAASSVLQYPNITSINGMRYRAADGSFTSDSRKAISNDALVTVVTNGVEKEITKKELETLMGAVVRGNDAVRGYLLQDTLVKDYYGGGQNPVDGYNRLQNDPALMERVINNIIPDLASALQYKQKVSESDIKALNLYSNTSTGSDNGVPSNPWQIGASGVSGITKYTDRESLEAAKAASNTITDNIFDNTLRYDKQPFTEEQKALGKELLLNGSYDDLVKFANDNGIGLDYLLEQRSNLKTANNATELATAKERNIANKLLASGKYDGLIDIEYTPSGKYADNAVRYFAEMGIDIKDQPGSSAIEKAYNMRSAIQEKLGIEDRTITDESGNPIKFLEGTDLEMLRKLNDKYSNKKYRQYKSDFNKMLKEENEAVTGITSTELPVFDSKSPALKKSQIDDVKGLLSNIAVISDARKFTTDTRSEITSMDGEVGTKLHKILSNLDDVNIYTTNIPVEGSSKSFRVIYKSKATNDTKGEQISILIPMDASKTGGLENELYNRFVKNNPMVKANDLVNDWKFANVTDDFSYTEHPNVSFRKTKGKDQYYVYNPDTKRFDPTTQDVATKVLASNIDNYDFKFNIQKEANDVLNTYSNVKESILAYKNPNATEDEKEIILDKINKLLEANKTFKNLPDNDKEYTAKLLMLYLTDNNQ